MGKGPYIEYLDSTLEELEHKRWGNMPPNATTLVKTSYELRKKRLKDYSPEDLRVMIGQKQSLKYLIPIAINFLQQNPFVEGDYYEGDLLQNVLSCPCEFWRQHPEYMEDVSRIIIVAKTEMAEIDLDDEIKNKISELIVDFNKCIGS